MTILYGILTKPADPPPNAYDCIGLVPFLGIGSQPSGQATMFCLSLHSSKIDIITLKRLTVTLLNWRR